jgi:hypothetical protein
MNNSEQTGLNTVTGLHFVMLQGRIEQVQYKHMSEHKWNFSVQNFTKFIHKTNFTVMLNKCTEVLEFTVQL